MSRSTSDPWQLMTDLAVRRDLICFSAMISACEKVAAWHLALHLFESMVQERGWSQLSTTQWSSVVISGQAVVWSWRFLLVGDEQSVPGSALEAESFLYHGFCMDAEMEWIVSPMQKGIFFGWSYIYIQTGIILYNIYMTYRKFWGVNMVNPGVLKSWCCDV